MTAFVHVLNPKYVVLSITNTTRGWTFSRKISFISQDTSTAEWIVSAPANCVSYLCTQASLANFHKVTMQKASAVGGGTTGNLKHRPWKVTPVKLVPGRLLVPMLTNNPAAVTYFKHGRAASPAGATPSAPSHDGSSFSISWVKVAKGV